MLRVLCWIYLAVDAKENHHKFTLKLLIMGIIISAVIANSIILLSDTHKKHSTSLWILNITGAVASSLAIIAVRRHGIHGLHGKSYLFLMLGIISWFLADLSLLYYYYTLGIEDLKFVSVADALWFAGYVFLTLHLFTVLRLIRNKINSTIVVLVSVITLIFVTYNVLSLDSSEFLIDIDFVALVVTIAYPILDLLLIIPSTVILLTLRKDYEHSIPWLLSSLSLLVNAIADDGYLNNFVHGHSQSIWIWDLFYVTDFIIMAGALFWYNKYHITNELRKARVKL
jgi:hypothetical protein